MEILANAEPVSLHKVADGNKGEVTGTTGRLHRHALPRTQCHSHTAIDLDACESGADCLLHKFFKAQFFHRDASDEESISLAIP
jgi:hypothetical protein